MKRLDLIQGDYSDHTTWTTLSDTLDKHKSEMAVFYMAIPPTMFPTVAQSLASVGLNERGRIVVEKPFGRDLASAIELNATLHSVFPEERIFRIDHYLGKESVEDLLVFRFSNTLLEPVWNRNYVRSVQITMSETIGVEGRGSFYDGVGAIRDVMQNHLLQVMALVAMEPPVGPDASYLQDEKAKVLRGDATDRSGEARARPVRRLPRRAGRRRRTRRSRRSSPRGSRSTRGDGPACRGTSAAGKALPASATEVVVEFKEPPRLLFDEAGGPPPARNLVRFRLGQQGRRHVHPAGQDARASTSTARTSTSPSTSPPRSASDTRPTSGCSTTPSPASPRRFAREDVVEQTWRIVQPALDTPGPVHPYFRGAWGPDRSRPDPRRRHLVHPHRLATSRRSTRYGPIRPVSRRAMPDLSRRRGCGGGRRPRCRRLVVHGHAQTP